MDVRGVVGLGGVMLAAMVAQFNDQVASIALQDVSGGLGLSHDAASWFRTVFLMGEVFGMSVAPSLGLIASFRRFALFTIFLSCAPTLAIPFVRPLPALLILRVLQGLAAGFTIPLLMTIALKVLTPEIRLYGLAVYAMTATLVPNLAASLAGLWTDVVDDWRFVFFEALPICAMAAVLVWWGMEQERPQLERIAKFDWTGALLLLAGFGSLTVVLEQGDWLDWFASPVICVLSLVSVVAIPLFILNEFRVEVPLFGFTLLKRRNFLYATLTLILFLVVALSASQVPLTFLEEVRGFKPLQAQGLTLEIAASQLVLLPATALLLDLAWLDSRWVSAVGLLCIIAACVLGAGAAGAWSTDEFVIAELLQSVGFSFVVMPLLMMATNTVTPEEGPYASALVNAPRALAEALGVFALQFISRWRGALHRTRIIEIIGQDRLTAVQAAPIPGLTRPPLTPAGAPTGSGALEALNGLVNQQTAVLVTIDAFLILAGVAGVLMILLAVVPERTYPPRIALAGQ